MATYGHDGGDGMKSSDATMTTTSSNPSPSPASEDIVRRGDRWLAGLVVFLIALVIVACLIGWAALSRQGRATCYQLVQVEQAEASARRLAEDPSRTPVEHREDVARANGLKQYASGLRAIVPSCPKPDPPEEANT